MNAARIYYIFGAFIQVGFSCSITGYGPLLQNELGLSLGEISLVNAVFWMVVIAAELPTGMLADGKSRTWSLRMGVLFYGVGGLSYMLATGIVSAMISEGFIAIGVAFLSGALQAWIADALDREGRKEDLTKVYATSALIRGAIFLVGGLFGSWLATHNARLIWLPFMLMGPIAALFSWRFMNGQGEALEYTNEWMAFKGAVSHLRRSRALKWSIASLVVFGAILSFNHFWTLYYIPEVGQLGLGWIWIVIYTSVTFSGWWIRRRNIRPGHETNWIVVSVLLTGVGLFLASLSPVLMLSMPGVIVHELGRGLFDPLSSSFVQSRIHTTYRATFGSLKSFLGRIGFVIVPFVIWVTLDGRPDTQETIAITWMISAAVLVLGAGMLWIFRPRAESQ
ncbi:MAG: MFS transporter [bacterium]|jgi:MFS family permease|nr:MFS transporter [bacterium]